jgi:hypothetical protein
MPIDALGRLSYDRRQGDFMLFYVGPDQFIPLTGFIGTVVGMALIFWGKITNGIRRLFARPALNGGKAPEGPGIQDSPEKP